MRLKSASLMAGLCSIHGVEFHTVWTIQLPGRPGRVNNKLGVKHLLKNF